MEAEEETWEHGGVFASLTHRHQRNIPKGTQSGDSDRQNSFTETMTFPQPLPITWEWLGLGAVWKYFLLHSYHSSRFTLKRNFLARLCTDCDGGIMIVN